MKNIIDEHTPFEHKDLEYINNSLNLARNQRTEGKLEGMMAAALIYTNLVEYLADNLLENLHHMVYLASYRDFQGTFFIKKKDDVKRGPPKQLGKLIGMLELYEFPDSVGFLGSLKEFSQKRNKIFHRLLKVSKEELSEIDADFIALHNIAEEILNKYNALTSGVTTVWSNFVVKHRTSQREAEEKNLKINELQEQIANLLSTIQSLQAQLSSSTLAIESPKENIVKNIVKKKVKKRK